MATLSEQPKISYDRRRETIQFFAEVLDENLNIEMVQIPAGTFTMGSPEDELERFNSEGPQHNVTVKEFFMGQYPVTKAQWRFVAGLPQIEQTLEIDPSNFKGDNLPVEQVSWYDAVEFCRRLSAHMGREYGLPTEAEWEYACRAGTTTPFHFGQMITTQVVNYAGASYAGGPEGEFREKTTPVDHFGIANAFGLCDMHGNVWEWCQDHWHDNYKRAPTDGSVWLTSEISSSRVVRGGSWNDTPRNCRSASRNLDAPDLRFNDIGFRVVCHAPRALQ
ncbi:formylglycine-generating enzyme family protein [Leptolyngbya cf. ectocarpi LEGE 11479]|uniref:Formylglycine-generating enzyme family protein n=1 Tax=Leptolyngbya cf. ectocarpi LEGE 11479 TaxID=1828722 RepID=A0A928WXR9_LEPEC|nr:formylglycine-generating enzyme family protein [Leptolyngbya ectocarpi]MBE9065287.1 formylglycine-generating enzyme family protein [Leptolyngbya cf. ectocarpi LEGE 11479]